MKTADEPETSVAPRSPRAPKPPYKIPDLAEILASPPNGLEAVSTFSGCGGTSLGLRWAGFKVRWASEFIEAAADTYRANFRTTPVDSRDIREVKPEEILAAVGKKEGELDLFEGSPPCSSFSSAGNREQDWGKVKKYSDRPGGQRTDDLFFEYVRLLRGLRPRAFCAENVKGLVIGAAKGYFKEILRELKASGYRVACRVLDAQWLGVPQRRARTIFVGFREDLGIDPVHPAPFPYRYTLRDACPWIERATHDTYGRGSLRPRGFSEGDITNRPIPTLTVGVRSLNATHFKVLKQDPELLAKELEAVSFKGYALEKEWKKLRPGESSDKYLNLVRAHPDRPCPTVTQTGGSSPGTAGVTHPFEPRKFLMLELKRVCGFPDDFVLTGSYEQQWERCGRAVPPPMSRAVATGIAAKLLELDAAKKPRRAAARKKT